LEKRDTALHMENARKKDIIVIHVMDWYPFCCSNG
jgi:hypothetical protein